MGLNQHIRWWYDEDDDYDDDCYGDVNGVDYNDVVVDFDYYDNNNGSVYNYDNKGNVHYDDHKMDGDDSSSNR